MTSEEFNQSSEPLNDLTAFLQNLDYSSRCIDERLDRMADRQFRTVDSHLNTTMSNFIFEREVLRKVPFRETES